ncbi:MAG: radical SAM family heme chaperone HemW [Gammaproteobacteria bacterium]
MRVERIPLALYVHWPWCARKCPYCDFNSHAWRDPIPDDDYLGALLRDLDFVIGDLARRPLESIFLGGGTPSLMSAASVQRLLDAIAARLPFAPDVEITMEANPGTAEAGRFADYRRAGVNRLSIGVQSLRDPLLAAIGRIHDAAQARAAFDMARRAGFDNVNVDLMYALPGDDAAGALSDLEAAIDWQPEQISWYQLTLEPGTPFHHRPPPLPQDDEVEAMEDRGHARLAARGYGRYEVSAYARPGRRCRHNLNYWSYGDYLGIGAGAHAKVTGLNAIQRSARQREPRRYMAAAGTPGVATIETVAAPGRRVFEFLLNALRLVDGFERRIFAERTGLPEGVLLAALEPLRTRNLVQVADDRIAATAHGLRYLNEALVLLPDA